MSDTGSDDGGGPFQSRADGQLHFEPGTAANTFPVAAPVDATPLSEDEPEGTVPASPLWAMKERAHGGIHLFGHPARIRACAGTGDAAVYAIDDGPHHCMIGRPVGATTDGCVFVELPAGTYSVSLSTPSGYSTPFAGYPLQSTATASEIINAQQTTVDLNGLYFDEGDTVARAGKRQREARAD